MTHHWRHEQSLANPQICDECKRPWPCLVDRLRAQKAALLAVLERAKAHVQRHWHLPDETPSPGYCDLCIINAAIAAVKGE